MNTSKNLPRLANINVPWAISPSTAFLQLKWKEGEYNACVDFVAFFKQFSSNRVWSSKQVQIVAEPEEFNMSHDETGYPYRRVRMVFDHVKHARISSSFAEFHVIDYSKYDWSAVPGAYRDDEPIDEYLKRSTTLWLETGICPDSRVYVVENSSLLGQIDEDIDPDRHFLILGDESSIDIVAKKMRWYLGQPLLGW